MQVMSMLVYCRDPYQSPGERSVIKIPKKSRWVSRSHHGCLKRADQSGGPLPMVANANVKNSLHFRRQMGRYLGRLRIRLGGATSLSRWEG